MQPLPASEPNTNLVFPSPSLREEFGDAGSGMIIFLLLILVILVGAAALIFSRLWLAAAGGAVILLGATCVAAVLRMRRGRVVLDADGLVETNGWNAARRFGYDQIFDFTNGAYAHTLVIHYYPRLRNGTLDTLHPRSTRLISVRELAALKSHLARRITAARVEAPAAADRLPMFLSLVFLLVAALVLLVFLLNWF